RREAADHIVGAVELLGSLEAVDRAQDHVERDPPHVVAQRERLADRPRLQVAARRVERDIAVVVDRAAVERRQQQLALAHARLLGRRRATATLSCTAVASARVERASDWRNPKPDKAGGVVTGGAVPHAKSLASSVAVTAGKKGTTHVVCQSNSLALLKTSIAD